MFQGMGWKVSNDWKLNNVDLVCFTGGTDVSPTYYGQGLHPRSQSPDIARDTLEKDVFLYCEGQGIPMVGVCRGAQFLCVGNNGALVQHISNHAINGRHDIITDQGTFNVSSSHHQMMDLSGTKHTLIGYANELSEFYEGATKDNTAFRFKREVMPKDASGSVIEPEIVFFPETLSLCHQPHPEWQIGSPYEKFFFDTIEQYLGVKA